MSYLRGGVGSSHLANQALQQLSYSTDAQAVATEVARLPASQYLTLNSKNRNQTSQVTSAGVFTLPASIVGIPQLVSQPWNNFKLNRPQALMSAFATRIVVSEINFPWYLPNINYNNNVAYFSTNTGENLRFYPFPVGFYTPAQFVSAWNDFFESPNDPVLSYNSVTGQFKLVATAPFQLLPISNIQQDSPACTSNRGLLYDTLGFSRYVGVTIPAVLTGDPTTFLYTQYIDVVCDKINQYATTRDGSSDNVINGSLMCRIYCADEISLAQTAPPFVGQTAGIIHRQFKNPKAIMWNKEANIDWLDISLYDEWGFLVPLTLSGITTGGFASQLAPYPDFQITLLASEN